MHEERMTNQEIASVFREMAAYLDMENVQFKPRAYEKVAYTLESLDESVSETARIGGISALIKIPGIGRGIAQHILDLVKDGHFTEHDHFKKAIPVKVLDLMKVSGLGPKMIKVLWKELQIRDLTDLETAAKAGRIRRLPRFGEKSEQKILKGLEFVKKAEGRRLLGFILPEVRGLEKVIAAYPEALQVEIAGSIRRRRETIGDIDILVSTSNPDGVIDRFLNLSLIDHVYGKGPTKINVRLKNGLDADLRIVPEESFGAALCYFTGSKQHNIRLREIAVKKGWKLNEYGLYEGDRLIAGRTESGIYMALGLSYVDPELREDLGEIDAARTRNLPALIGYGDLKGDLQIQTDWTDGANTIEEMADAAEATGLEYIAITDHTKSLPMTGGSDEKKLRNQITAVQTLNRKLKLKKRKITILTGAEVNIMKDGSLDIDDEVLAELDVVGAAVHHHFDLPRDEQTQRVVRAMENPNVDILFHPTSRAIHRRAPIELDVDAIIEAAGRTGTILEIDASPERLDLKDEYIRKCVEAGVRMCIDSDAHATTEFSFLEFGIAQARRGWATRKDIINTLPVKRFLASLKKG